MKHSASLSRPLAAVLGLTALFLTAALLLTPGGAAQDPPPMQASAANAVPAEGCELMQTLEYDRCGHTVTRRFTAPVETHGKDLEGVQALYPDWQITEFSAALVRMQRRMQLFCPDHMVLMPDGAGMLCVFENRYGDAMALVRELQIPLDSLPSAAREEVQPGLGFSTAEELEQWLESAES